MLIQRSGLGQLLSRLESRSQLARRDRHAVLALPHNVTSVAAGHYIVREGQKPERCYVLLEGFAYRHKVVGNGGRQILGLHMAGDPVLLQDALLDVADHNVQALTPAMLAVIPAQAVAELVLRHSAVAHAILVDSLIEASISREWMANVGRRDSRSRMAHLLCELHMRQGRIGLAEDDGYELPMTQEQFADALGLTSVHVNRTLKGLEAEGLISRHRRTLRIEDWQALQRVGDFKPAYLHLAPRDEAPARRNGTVQPVLEESLAVH